MDVAGKAAPALLGRKSLVVGALTSVGLVVADATRASAEVVDPVGYVPRWAPFTQYAGGRQVVSPNNDVVSATVAHRSSAAYATDTAKWTLSSTYLTPTVASATYLKSAAANSTFGLRWQPLTAYLAGDVVTNPTGDVVTAKVNFTSGGSYVATNWNLSPTFARAQRAAIGNALVTLGDSQTTGAGTYVRTATQEVIGAAWPSVVGWATGQRVRVVRNAGVSGQRSDEMLARFDTDVTPWAPTAVTLLAGANDISQNVSLATFQANVAAIVAKTLAIGAVPVLATIPPRTPTATYGQRVSLWNHWLRGYALANGYPILDFNTLLTDPATGNLKAALDSGDGLHCNQAGWVAMGTYAAGVLKLMSREWSPPLPVSNVDPNNLLANALMLTDTTPADGKADGWSNYGVSQTNTTIPGTGPTLGNWQQFVATAAGQGFTKSTATGWAVGDRMAFCGRFDTDGALFYAMLTATGSPGTNYVRAVGSTTEPIRDGVWYGELVVPTGTTSLEVRITAGIGTHKYGQVGLYNLTALGLV